MARKKTNAYSESFRKEAVRLADQPDRTATDVARELGIHVGQIYNWRTQFNKLSKGQFTAVEGTNYSVAEKAEIRKLKKEVAKLLQEKSLRARNGKGFKYRVRIESKTNVADNLLARQFKADAPNTKWVSDITYIKVNRTWLYLAVVLDLFSRKIIGWCLENHMRESLILNAFNMAVSSRDIEQGALIHSDRGVQYRGHEYQHVIKENGILCSMSRKGNCWDNAVMESFFGRFKVELIYAENYKTVEAAQSGIFEYIEIFYNRQRRHSAINNMSPHEYEMQYNQFNVSTIRG